MMPNHERIYKEDALTYDEMIARQPLLRDIVNEICPIQGLDIVDLGAGTGRLTIPLAGDARSMMALDVSSAMLETAGNRLRVAGLTNWGTAVADHRSLPLEDHCADLVVSGWSICYLCSSHMPEWRENLSLVMQEIRRITRSGGMVILFETMGTGTETPAPPDFLVPYYEALEREYGFSHRWTRLDYSFESAEQAERLTRFFFGDELADRVAREGLARVPECAGIWWKRLE